MLRVNLLMKTNSFSSTAYNFINNIELLTQKIIIEVIIGINKNKLRNIINFFS